MWTLEDGEEGAIPRRGLLTDHSDWWGGRSRGLLPREPVDGAGQRVSKACRNAPARHCGGGRLRGGEKGKLGEHEKGRGCSSKRDAPRIPLPREPPPGAGAQAQSPQWPPFLRAIEPWRLLSREPMASVRERELRPRGVKAALRGLLATSVPLPIGLGRSPRGYDFAIFFCGSTELCLCCAPFPGFGW